MERSADLNQVSLKLAGEIQRPLHGSRDAWSRDEAWSELLLSRPAEQLAKNVRTEWALLQVGNVIMPTTINETEYKNSYVCSPYTGCVLYPQSEVKKLESKALRWAILTLVKSMGPCLRASQINRVVCVNNWLLSTNLYCDFDESSVSEITRLIADRFPSHAIAFRSLNEVTNASLLNRLRAEGYLLAPSRQVYFFDGASGAFMAKQNNSWDRKLLQETPYEVVRHQQFMDQDAHRIEELYRWLYVDKYSPHNPQFTAEMLAECMRRELLTFWGLRTKEGRLDGVVGTFERQGVVTAPIVGYDTSLPQQLGLYRMLMSIVLQEAARSKLRLNLSSGASHFKRIRGGVPCIEYTAVYCRHLPPMRRLAWRTLSLLTQKVGAPILQKYEL